MNIRTCKDRHRALRQGKLTLCNLHTQQLSDNAVSLIERIIAFLVWNVPKVCAAQSLGFKFVDEQQLQHGQRQSRSTRRVFLGSEFQRITPVFVVINDPLAADLSTQNVLGSIKLSATQHSLQSTQVLTNLCSVQDSMHALVIGYIQQAMLGEIPSE